ncbi:hypothetical protein EON65_42455 [archaeon]|nr:MAG: hypothetical protein EON65_42455 [archaeon]
MQAWLSTWTEQSNAADTDIASPYCLCGLLTDLFAIHVVFFDCSTHDHLVSVRQEEVQRSISLIYWQP